MSGKRFEKVLEWAIYALIVAMPLARASVLPWAFKLEESVVFVLLALWALKARRSGGFSCVKTPLLYALPLLPVFVILQIIPLPEGLVYAISPGRHVLDEAAGTSGRTGAFALYPWATKDKGIFVFSVLAMFLLVINHIRSKAQIQRITYLVMGMGVLLAFGAFAQKAAAPGRISFLPFVNRNHFAGYMELALPLAAAPLAVGMAGAFRRKGVKDFLARLFSGPEGTLTVIKVFYVLLLASAVLLTLSRGGVLGLLFSFVVIGGLISKNRRVALSLAGVLAVVLMVSLSWADKDLIERRIGTLTDVEEDNSAMFRVQIWKDTLNVVRDFPVMGVGLGGLESAYPYYKTFKKERSVFQPENDYLYILVEGGAVGFIFAGAFYVMLVGPMLLRFRKRKDPFAVGMGAAGLSAMAALTIHGFVDTNFHIPSNLFLLAVIMALSYVALNGRFDNGDGDDGLKRVRVVLGPGKGRAAMSAVALLCAATAAISLAGVAGDIAYRDVLNDIESLRIKSAGAGPDDYMGINDELSLAARLDPGRADYYYYKGIVNSDLAYYISNMEKEGRELQGLHASWSYYEDAYQSFINSLRCNPYYSYAHLMAGKMLEYGLSENEGGEKQYAAAERLNPTSPYIKKYLSDYYMKTGRVELAKRYAASVPDLDPSYNTITISSLVADSGDEAYIGEVVVWKVSASALRGGLEYKFLVWRGSFWGEATTYTEKPYWAWKTGDEKPGTYFVKVMVRGADGRATEQAFVRKEPFRLRELENN